MMATAAYNLSEDAYVCVADDYLVFSDLRSDKYHCLSRTNTEILLRSLPAFKPTGVQTNRDVRASDRIQAQRVVQALAKGRLIVDASEPGRTFAPIEMPEPSCSILSQTTDSPTGCSLGESTSFLCSSLKASAKLRYLPLRQTVRGIERRKRQLCRSTRNDDDTLRRLVMIFNRLRPYYGRDYLCRFDSLALVEFLACYRQFPQWVFGVKSQPFGAHCWVQNGPCLLNDSIDYVRQFTPIMAF